MQGSLQSERVLNRAETVDYFWVKAGNGKFSFLLMEKVVEAAAHSLRGKIAFLSCSLFCLLYTELELLEFINIISITFDITIQLFCLSQSVYPR